MDGAAPSKASRFSNVSAVGGPVRGLRRASKPSDALNDPAKSIGVFNLITKCFVCVKSNWSCQYLEFRIQVD
jgi:hypothetical protein